MAEKWSTLLRAPGPDLHVDLDRSDLRRSLQTMLRDAVRSGRLAAGTRLPATRTLAVDLGVARGTVTQAYEQLIAEGYLTARQGSGTRVARLPARATPPASPPAAPPARPASWDFTPGTPDVSAFPRAAWTTATKRVLASCPSEVFGYGDPRGTAALRQALAGYLGRARGVQTSPGQIVVCSGYTHALTLLATALRARGVGEIGFEDPSLPQHRHLVTRAGLTVRGIGVDGNGVRVREISSAAVVVTPAHQYPTGVTLAPARRAQLADWALSGGLVIEDDYDGEFRYDREPVGAMQGLAPDRVVYAGTASKTLAPGLRLAWLALPPAMVAEIVDLRLDVDRHPSIIDQLVLADMIGSGAYDRHVRQCRNRYRARRDRLVTQLARQAPGVAARGIAAGLHVVLELPPGGPGEDEVIALARHRDIAVSGLADHRMAGAQTTSALIVGYAKPPSHAFEPALSALTGLLGDVTARSADTGQGFTTRTVPVHQA